MTGEYRITRHTWETNFRGEYDSLTHTPYEVGDVVVRCANCRGVIKAEVVDGSCPLCGNAPFSSAPVIVSHRVRIHAPRYFNRSELLFAFLAPLSSFLALVPFLFEELAEDLHESMYHIDYALMAYLLLAVGAAAALVLILCPTTCRFWSRHKWGPVLLVVPPLIPYAILFCIWAVIGIAYIGFYLLAIAVVLGIMFGFIAGLSEL